jgi:hypothetical protein
MADFLADSWLDSFHGMYAASCDNADAIADFDLRLEILRRKISFDEKRKLLAGLSPHWIKR